MRAFCTVSAPFEVCAPPTRPLSPGSRFLALRLLGSPQPQTLYFLVEAKSRVREVYAQTCLHFAKQGMLDTELFGLAVLIDGEYMFADPESKLSKYGPKSWRSSHTHGLDANGRPLLELHFRVQFYIESPFMLRDETSRHNYYLQLKANAISRDVPKEYSEQSMILLGGLALQADFGNYITVTKIKAKSSSTPAAASSILPSATTISTTTTTSATKTNIEDDCNEESTASALTSSSSSSIGDGNIGIDEKIHKTNHKISTKVDGSNSSSSGGCNNGTNRINKCANNKSQMNHIIGVPSSLSTSSLVSNSSTSVAMSASSSSSSTSSVVTDLSSSVTNSSTDYFRIEEYLPVGLHSAWSASALRSCHRENHGMSQAEAKLNYIRQACSLHEAINAHVCRMKLSKNECGQGSVWFVVYAKGIRIYGDNTQPITFLWPNIIKLSFERKKFEIRSGENKITLYSSSDEKNKMMLTLCKETHQFSMKIATRLKEAMRREEEENSCLDYIYSRSLHLTYKNKNDQRISVISSTSSNTTSGIVSDRVHSEDELEIMINTPPVAPIAAPSTESLALAHLLDRPSVSRQTSSAGQVSLKDLGDHLAAALSKTRSISNESTSCGMNGTDRCVIERQNSDRSRSGTGGGDSTETDSPNSIHNIGSQCSSTCSTVVVAPDTITLSSLVAHSTSINRRPSTSSSLELGFSHTAQNSTLSEGASTCVDHEYTTTNDCENDENASGVYTLEHGAPPTETSGVYTMNSSEMTGQSSEIAESESHESSHYGIFMPKNNLVDVDEGVIENADSVDGNNKYNRNRMKTDDMSEFRMRSDSNVSASGSFRGDGSDPTDNKHNLLTAEELTDLIVGRGTYPSRKNVGNTLDSDCDYVTLPLSLEGDSYIQGHEDTAPTEDNDDMMDQILPTDPPIPPKRIDSNMHHSLSSLVDIRMRSPPPYNARHETTGLCGPPVRKSIPNLTNIPLIPIPTAIQSPNITSIQSVSTSASTIPLRDPPPYPQQPVQVQSIKTTPVQLKSFNQLSLPVVKKHQSSVAAVKAEEATARFITTRPQINILKAHTSVINDNAKPSYAAPTIPNIVTSTSTTSVPSTQIHSSHQHQMQQSTPPASTPHHHHHRTQNQSSMPVASPIQSISSTIGIPIVPYSLHTAHKSMSSIPPPPPPYHHDVMKSQAPRTCVLLPVIKPRQYLPPPPPTLPRQPPPPPPSHQLATVYTSQLARSQIELYQQQLYSDVDYVIYPIQDPAVSQQEYLDAKQGSILAAMAQSPPPPPYLAYHAANPHTNTWDACKGHAIYRSTPYLPMALSAHHPRYASTQNLSDTYVQLPGAYSPLYSPSVASLCSSYEPPPPPPLRATTLAAAQTLFARSRSDDNILNSIETMPKMKRLPPPPPPYVNRRAKKPPMPVPTEKPPPIPMKTMLHQHQHHAGSSTLPHQSSSHHNRRSLPATHQLSILSSAPPPAYSKQIPMISAQNQTLGTTAIAQFIAANNTSIVTPSQITANNALSNQNLNTTISTAATTTATSNNTTTSITSHGNNNNNGSTASTSASSIDIQILREKSRNMDLPLISALCNDRSLLKQTKAFVMPKHPRNSLTSSSLSQSPGKSSKYPVSGLSTTQLTKQRNKTSISHRHPNDKLPPLPMQTAEANNYVMDPTPSAIKHKNFNSQPST